MAVVQNLEEVSAYRWPKFLPNEIISFIFFTASYARLGPIFAMFRQRLKLKTGCHRCRQRRKKCDEQRPRCGYCTKWNYVSCVYDSLKTPSKENNGSKKVSLQISRENWPSNPSSSSQNRRELTQSSKNMNVLPRGVAPDTLYPFHPLPIPDTEQRSEANRRLWFFFRDMINDATPYDVVLPRQMLRQGWCESICSDSAVCCAFLAYTARFAVQILQDETKHTFSLEFEIRTLRLIQDKLDQGNWADQNILLAIAVHIMNSAFENFSSKHLRGLTRGIKLIIQERGGLAQIFPDLSFSTFISLVISDGIVARCTGEYPIVDVLPEPVPPSSLNGYFVSINGPPLQGYEVRIARLLEKLKFLSLFRKPAFVARTLSNVEASYIFQLQVWIDVELNYLQWLHAKAGDLSEIIILTLIIFKVETLGGGSQHRGLLRTVLGRLKIAMVTYLGMKAPKQLNSVVIWSCIVVVTAISDLDSETAFYQQILSASDCVANGIPADVWRLPWHRNLNNALEKCIETLGLSKLNTTCLYFGP